MSPPSQRPPPPPFPPRAAPVSKPPPLSSPSSSPALGLDLPARPRHNPRTPAPNPPPDSLHRHSHHRPRLHQPCAGARRSPSRASARAAAPTPPTRPPSRTTSARTSSSASPFLCSLSRALPRVDAALATTPLSLSSSHASSGLTRSLVPPHCSVGLINLGNSCVPSSSSSRVAASLSRRRTSDAACEPQAGARTYPSLPLQVLLQHDRPVAVGDTAPERHHPGRTRLVARPAHPLARLVRLQPGPRPARVAAADDGRAPRPPRQARPVRQRRRDARQEGVQPQGPPAPAEPQARRVRRGDAAGLARAPAPPHRRRHDGGARCASRSPSMSLRFVRSSAPTDSFPSAPLAAHQEDRRAGPRHRHRGAAPPGHARPQRDRDAPAQRRRAPRPRRRRGRRRPRVGRLVVVLGLELVLVVERRRVGRGRARPVAARAQEAPAQAVRRQHLRGQARELHHLRRVQERCVLLSLPVSLARTLHPADDDASALAVSLTKEDFMDISLPLRDDAGNKMRKVRPLPALLSLACTLADDTLHPHSATASAARSRPASSRASRARRRARTPTRPRRRRRSGRARSTARRATGARTRRTRAAQPAAAPGARRRPRPTRRTRITSGRPASRTATASGRSTRRSSRARSRARGTRASTRPSSRATRPARRCAQTAPSRAPPRRATRRRSGVP